MKKVISMALSLVLLSSALTCSLSAQSAEETAAQADAGSLICSDPGFETNLLTRGAPATDSVMGAWSDEQMTTYDAGISITDEDAATGNYSLKVKAPSWNIDCFSLGLNVEQNTTYALSFKIKTVGADGGALSNALPMKIAAYSDGTYGSDITSSYKINDERELAWQSRFITFNTGDTSIVHMVFANSSNTLTKSSTVYLDDISLEKITDGGIIEPLANGAGFEEPLETYIPTMSAGIPSWSESQRNEWNGGVTQSAENPHSGKYSVKINDPWSGADIGFATFNVCADTDYVLKFWARCDADNVSTGATVYVKEVSSIAWNNVEYSATPLMSDTAIGSQLSAEWKQFTYVFHSVNEGMVQLFAKSSTGQTPIYFDDVTLQKSQLKNGAFETDADGWSGTDSAVADWDQYSHTSGEGSLKPVTNWEYQEVYTEFTVKPYTNYTISFNYQGTPNWLTAKVKTAYGETTLLQNNVAALCGIEETSWHAFANGILKFNSLNNESLELTFMGISQASSNDCGRLDDIYIVEELVNTVSKDNESGDADLLFDIDKNSASQGETVTVSLKAPLSDFVFDKGFENELYIVPEADADLANSDELASSDSVTAVTLSEDTETYTFTMSGYNMSAMVMATYKYDMNSDKKADLIDLIKLKKASAEETPQYGAEDLTKLRVYLLTN